MIKDDNILNTTITELTMLNTKGLHNKGFYVLMKSSA